ncbi:MAG: oligosaccharide flippase family protein [Paracoccaceae bacterium]
MIESEADSARTAQGRSTFNKILLLLSGNIISSLLTLLRNLLVARLISKEDYGIAATFAIVMTLIEMISAFGLHQQVIQSKRDDLKWQAALQGFQMMRAVMSAAILFFCAGMIADFMGVPQITWAYQLLAVVPILNGFLHLDIYRLNRQMVYGPMILSTTVPALVSFIAIWPLFLLFGDFRVMLWSILIQTGLMSLLSILTAERAFRLRLDRSSFKQVIRFGWPLLINNILLVIVMNGEKIVVGRELGMTSLAIFAMGFTLTLTPTLVLSKSVQSFFLPQLSAAQDDDARFQPLARATVEANFFNGALLVFAVVLLGEPFINLVLGQKYADLVPLMVWMAILHAIRVFKAGGAVAALARAKTENAMVANSFRIISLPLSWWAAVQTGDLLLVIWIATLGEAAGVVASLLLMRWRAKVALSRLWPVCVAVGLLLVTAALYALQPTSDLLSNVPRWSLVALCGALLGLCIWTMRDARAYIKAPKIQGFGPA